MCIFACKIYLRMKNLNDVQCMYMCMLLDITGSNFETCQNEQALAKIQISVPY